MPTPPPTHPLRWALAAAVLAPILWGVSWIGITEFMPAHRPVYAACLRTLPIGLMLLACVRRLPTGRWWLRAVVLGALNFGIFYALLTVAAYRVPGGVAATMGALQPLMVLALGIPLLHIAPNGRHVMAGAIGIAGVSLLVFSPAIELDAIGILAAVGAVASMSAGVVLTKRWSDPDVSPLTSTAWQLTAGGLMLTVAALAIEGAPPPPTHHTFIAVLFVGVVCTGLANWLWFVGLASIPAARASSLTLLS
ncbi:MAG: EamA family transporter, partial [Thermoleophilia bacterium]|nr:EamA family transporter [Thermoleophilia bacterium]